MSVDCVWIRDKYVRFILSCYVKIVRQPAHCTFPVSIMGSPYCALLLTFPLYMHKMGQTPYRFEKPIYPMLPLRTLS